MNNKKGVQFKNPLEALRDLGGGTIESLRAELLNPLPSEIIGQIMGSKTNHEPLSGEIVPGEELKIREVYSGHRKETEAYQAQIRIEQTLGREEEVLVERRTNELRIRIHAIHQEVTRIAEATPKLTQELKIAAFKAPVSTSEHDLNVLQNIFEFIQNFRKRIEHSGTWLAAANKRGSKRNMWGQNYKKHGAKYLLSGEHYSGRSAA